MKAPLLFACLLSFVGCNPPSEQQHRYDQRQLAALGQVAFPDAAAGLRFGMDSSTVEQQLASLRQRDALNWPLPSGHLPMQAEPEYVNGKLVKLNLLLRGNGLTNGPEHVALLRGLTQAYGEGYEHSPGDEGGVRSWFKGGTEVQLMTLSELGYALDYTDLPHVHALTLRYLRRDSLQIVQMEQEQRQKR